jgi:outer membrane protein TolC
MPSIGVGLYGLYRPSMNSSPQGASRLGGGVALTLRTPIFHFGQRSAALTTARAQLRRAELDVESVTDNIVRDESNGWTNLVLTHQRVEAVRRSLAVARENLDISTYAYQEGLATILDVLQAQISWLQIYQNSIAAHYDHAVAISSYKYIIAE